MTMLNAAHEHKICQIIFLLKALLETIYWFNGIKVKLAKSNILLMAIVKIFPGYSTVKKYIKETFNLGSANWSPVDQMAF